MRFFKESGMVTLDPASTDKDRALLLHVVGMSHLPVSSATEVKCVYEVFKSTYVPLLEAHGVNDLSVVHFDKDAVEVVLPV